MGPGPTGTRPPLPSRFRLLLLLASGVLGAGWAASGYLRGAPGAAPPPPRPLGDLRPATTPGRDGTRTQALVAPRTQAGLAPCPARSPHLKGADRLAFPPSLTWDDVRRDNPGVRPGGRHRPPECRASQSVAVLVPHRARERHLLYLLATLHPFLQRQQLDYGLYVVHQAGSGKFNRARLLNAGYLQALRERPWDCFVFHDVDLVPENDHNVYSCGPQPRHLVVGRNSTGYRLRYQGYFGGVTALTRDQFARVNGFSNNYWGWGGEDDDLRIRVELQKMQITRPSPDVARYTMIFHTRDKGNEENAGRMKLLNQVGRVWKTDGLNSCSYQLLALDHAPLFTNVTVAFPPGS
ncbi:beta-1,4-galactosyltransferase 4 [Ornithorhynchus anatinus]|uniref:Beta-1,4-galactosyltransferase n=1 Tax=Ornithorhynchus anatinus TaxID=9258 RepID=A0A6I8NWM3_ORNAN|nr:beta-1,4-galactosyltransferase 4 [Ornithorhynchus anatinus]